MVNTVLASFDMLDDTYEMEMLELGDGEPVVTITAGIHGDESPSVRVAEHLIEEYSEADINGTLRIIPRANIFACTENTRETPWPKHEEYESEERNMNRCFDAARKRLEDEEIGLNLTQTMAYHVLEQVADADHLIDMHTATWPGSKIPQIRMKASDDFDDAVMDEMEAMVDHSGLAHVLRSRPSTIGGGVLAAVAPKIGVPAVTLEVGGSRHFSQEDFDTYLGAVEDMLAHIGVLDRDVEPDPPEVFTGLRSVYTPVSGAVEHVVSPGDRVEEGEVIAVVRDLDGGTRERIRAPVTGLVEMMNQKAAVNQGIRLAKIAYRG